MITKFHRANLSLAKLQEECEGVQGGIPGKLVHLQGAEVEIPVNNQNKFNRAQYVEIGNLDPTPTLKFEKVEKPADIPSMIAKALADKFLLIFDEILFVEDKEQRVLGFGKV